MRGMTPEEAENFYVEDEDPAPLFAAYDAARRAYDAARASVAVKVADGGSCGMTGASRALQLVITNPGTGTLYDLSVTGGTAVAAGTR